MTTDRVWVLDGYRNQVHIVRFTYTGPFAVGDALDRVEYYRMKGDGWLFKLRSGKFDAAPYSGAVQLTLKEGMEDGYRAQESRTGT